MKQTPANLHASRHARLYRAIVCADWTAWYYNSPDPLAQVRLPGYFGPSQLGFRVGDYLIVITRVISAKPVQSGIFLVEAVNEHGPILVEIARSAMPVAKR